MTSSNDLKDDRSTVRTLARRHPAWSNRKIAREIGRTHVFVAKWRDRDDSENLPRGNTRMNTVRTGEFVNSVKRQMVGMKKSKGGGKRRKMSIREVVKEFKSKGQRASFGTVQAAVQEVAVYRRRTKRVRLDEGYAERRFEFADNHLSWDEAKWATVLNTDSSPFYLMFKFNRQNDGFWCHEGMDPPGIDQDKFCIKTELYVGVCAQGVTKPVFVDSPRRVNSEIYTTEILPHFRREIFERNEETKCPTTTRLFEGDYLFQQDLAPSHWAKRSVAYLEKNIPNFMPKSETPPRFFEWPVEQFFNVLEQRVYKQGKAKDLAELKKWIRRDLKDPFWFTWCANTFATMNRRCVEVCEAEGWHTGN